MTVWSKTMTTLTILTVLATPIKPIAYAFLILLASITASFLMFKTSLTSWFSFVLIMVFSSGMMTLFVYITSLTPNEKSKNQLVAALLSILLTNPASSNPTKLGKTQMKSFSQQSLILFMIIALILTMLATATQSFNPQQSMASTF